MSSQIRSSRRMAEQLDLTRSTRHLCCIFNMSSRGGAQLASDVLKGYIIFREGSRTAWQPFRCNKSGAGSTRYSECIGGVRCGISISASWISLSPAAPPFVWRILFDCSCAWSLAIRLNCQRDFCTTKFFFMNSACTSGLCCASWTVWSRALN